MTELIKNNRKHIYSTGEFEEICQIELEINWSCKQYLTLALRPRRALVYLHGRNVSHCEQVAGLESTASLDNKASALTQSSPLLSSPRDVIASVSRMVIGCVRYLIYSECVLLYGAPSCVLIASFKVPSTSHALKEANHIIVCVCVCSLAALPVVETAVNL